MKSVGIVACSNPQKLGQVEENNRIFNYLKNEGQDLNFSDYIYEKEDGSYSSGQKRAQELMKFYANKDISDIYDISGGDMANEILDYLDFDLIKESQAVFWGYSDLTTIINAIYSQTGKPSVLYQIKHIEDLQGDLFSFTYEMIEGEKLEGIVLGGNIRCFLKLAGTKYFPDMTGKILLLEARSGGVEQMITYLSQLKSMGIFEKINGLILGTFTEMEDKNLSPNIVDLVKRFAASDLPIAKTSDIGHAKDSKAIWIGREVKIS